MLLFYHLSKIQTHFFFIIFAILKNYFGSLVMHKPDDDENLYFIWKILIS